MSDHLIDKEDKVLASVQPLNPFRKQTETSSCDENDEAVYFNYKIDSENELDSKIKQENLIADKAQHLITIEDNKKESIFKVTENSIIHNDDMTNNEKTFGSSSNEDKETNERQKKTHQ